MRVDACMFVQLCIHVCERQSERLSCGVDENIKLIVVKIE